MSTTINGSLGAMAEEDGGQRSHSERLAIAETIIGDHKEILKRMSVSIENLVRHEEHLRQLRDDIRSNNDSIRALDTQIRRVDELERKYYEFHAWANSRWKIAAAAGTVIAAIGGYLIQLLIKVVF